jgi:hypothetical protein
VSNNIIKYDGKTNPSVWLGDYRLTCKAGGVDDDLFIIQFLPIYLANMARAWLNYLPRSTIDAGRISRRSLPTTTRAHTCGWTTPEI